MMAQLVTTVLLLNWKRTAYIRFHQWPYRSTTSFRFYRIVIEYRTGERRSFGRLHWATGWNRLLGITLRQIFWAVGYTSLRCVRGELLRQ